MLTVPVRRDISTYERKLGKVSIRSLIFIIIGAAVGIAIGAGSYFLLHIDWDYSQWVVYPITGTIWLIGLYKPFKLGLPFEKAFPFWLRHNYGSTRCIYKATPALAKEGASNQSEDPEERMTDTYARLVRNRGIESVRFTELVTSGSGDESNGIYR